MYVTAPNWLTAPYDVPFTVMYTSVGFGVLMQTYLLATTVNFHPLDWV